MGFLLLKSKDFVTLSRDGMQAIALGSVQKRMV